MWGYVAFAVISTVAQLYMQQQESRSQEKIAKANQEMQLQEAEAVRQANELESQQFKKRAKAFLSQQRALAGGSGASLLSVSDREITAASERGIALDAEIIRKRGEAAYRREVNKADIYGMEARSIRRARPYQTARTILGGARDVYGYKSAYSSGFTAGRKG